MAKHITIRLNFLDKDAERFLTVKDNRGVKANNELIRILISEAYNEIQRAKKKAPLVEVPA
jgi:hypothetical protein